MSKISLHVETTARNLNNVLSIVKKVIERRNSIPVISMVLFEGKSVRATDLDMEIEIKLPVEIASGSSAIDFTSLHNIVSHTDGDDTVSIIVDDGLATVSVVGAKYRVPSLPASDFPKMRRWKFSSIKIDGGELKKAVRFTRPFVSTETTRYYLNGVFLNGSNVVATDGHRMGVFPIASSFSAAHGLIIPRKVAAIICDLPAPTSLKVAGSIAFKLQYDGLTITAKAIDGTFPDWTRVVPSFVDGAPVASFDKGRVLRTLTRFASVVCKRDWKFGVLAFGNGSAVIKRGDVELSGSEIVPAQTVSEFSVGLNFKYLADAFRAFQSAKMVSLMGSDAGSPMKVEADAGGEYVVIMPARVDGCQAALSEAITGVLV